MFEPFIFIVDMVLPLKKNHRRPFFPGFLTSSTGEHLRFVRFKKSRNHQNQEKSNQNIVNKRKSLKKEKKKSFFAGFDLSGIESNKNTCPNRYLIVLFLATHSEMPTYISCCCCIIDLRKSSRKIFKKSSHIRKGNQDTTD